MITRYAGDKITALSSDEFPTDVADGATLYTLDDFKIYIKQSGTWNLASSASSLDVYSIRFYVTN